MLVCVCWARLKVSPSPRLGSAPAAPPTCHEPHAAMPTEASHHSHAQALMAVHALGSMPEMLQLSLHVHVRAEISQTPCMRRACIAHGGPKPQLPHRLPFASYHAMMAMSAGHVHICVATVDSGCISMYHRENLKGSLLAGHPPAMTQPEFCSPIAVCSAWSCP